jgi:hypothetical protein
MKKTWPAAQRNAEPITSELRRLLKASSSVLEIASGTGQHAAHFTRAMPELHWQPSEYDSTGLASIEEWRQESGAKNFNAPVRLDVCDEAWPVESTDAIFCANMIHIAPWACCQGLVRGAGRVLPSQGALLLYGPFMAADTPTAPSNTAFDQSLRSRNPDWGIRDLEEVQAAALACELALEERIAMPANNLLLLFRRR